MAAATRPGVAAAEITNFSGGPNFRDSPTELAASESYDAFNCTFDERGGVQSRLGYIKRNLTPLGSSYKAQVLASTPKLYWRLDEGVGALTALDVSGNGLTGAYGGAVTLGQAGALTGDSDTAVLLGSSSSATVTSNSYIPPSSGSLRTYMGWAYRTSAAAGHPIFGWGNGAFAPSYLSLVAGVGDVTLTGRGGTLTWAAVWPGANQWVFWSLTINDTTHVAELFINGVSQGTRTAAGSNGNATSFFLGDFSTNWPDLYEDEFAVFESILSGAAISAIYTAAGGGAPARDYVVNDYYSPLLGVTLTQSGKSLYRADGTASVRTFSTAGCVTFTDFAGVVIAAHPVDGLWQSTDGTTWTKIVAANAPTTGTLCVAAWQARLFVGLTDGTVHWSDLGTIATWTNTNFVAVWEKDQQPVVALAVGSGQDIQGRPGLLVFKQDSTYRINNPTTGSYTSLSTSVGAAGPKAVVGVGTRVCWIGKHGIFWWREDQPAPVDASDLLRPLWRREQLSFANQAGWAAGRRLNRAYFSCSTINSNVNDFAIELHPDEGWVAPRSDAMTCYSTSTGVDEATYGGSPTAPGQMYQLDTGGADDGQSITGWFQTRWLIPNRGFQAQVWQARLHGRGAGTVTIRRDYEGSGGTAYSFNFAANAGGFLYDNGVLYDSGVHYGIVTLAESKELDGLGVCRQFSLRFGFTVNQTVAGRSLPGSTPAPALGAFGLYAVDVLHIPLGLS